MSTQEVVGYVKLLTDKSKSISNFVTNFKKTGKANWTGTFIKIRLKVLDDLWCKFEDLHGELISIIAETDKSLPYFVNNQYENSQAEYMDSHVFFDDLLLNLVTKENQQTPQTTKTFEPQSQIQLPRVNLPTFSGNYEEWSSFRDLFTALIDKNSNLTDVLRLQYLKTSLQGEAEQLLRNVETTEANYKVAWQRLTERFENKRMLIQTHVKALMSLNAVNVESSKDLKRLLDGTVEAVRALENLERPVEHWNDWLVFITANRLDSTTRKDWEDSLCVSTDPPTFKQLQIFLEGRIRTLEALSPVSKPPNTQSRRFGQNSSSHQNYNTHHVTAPQPDNSNQASNSTRKCPCCLDKHILTYCPVFRQNPQAQRQEIASKSAVCFNCLRTGHSVSECISTKRCLTCQGKHHTLLHRGTRAPTVSTATSTASTAADVNSQPNANQARTASHMIQGSFTRHTAVLLATALVIVESEDGRRVQLRALLDQGSEASFISETAAQQLHLKRTPQHIEVTGLGALKTSTANGVIRARLRSRINTDSCVSFSAFVLPKLTQLLPSASVDNEQRWPHVMNIELADPTFATPSRIDLLLGAEIFNQILLTGVQQGPPGTPIAQETIFGWVLTGPTTYNIQSQNVQPVQNFHCICNQDLLKTLQQFWETEEISTPQRMFTLDEQKCEQHFQDTVRRNSDGRYVVRLPLRSDQTTHLGESRRLARQKLISLERRLLANPDLDISYNQFMQDYLNLGHMIEVHNVDDIYKPPMQTYYLPHHGVVKTTSSTTKLRVVFNASSPTSTGSSLNNQLYIGPKLQNELYDVILHWRIHPIVFSADIEKMYRQIQVDTQDTDLQRILWRWSSSGPIRDFRLQTVTYGMSCAPYLAIRVLRQLARDERDRFPEGSQIVEDEFYVDDVLSGGDNISEALTRQNQLIQILQSGGFQLRKWASNHEDLMARIPPEHQENAAELQLNPDASVKTLGIIWCPTTDSFSFVVQIPDISETLTKRIVLSIISRLFDPLGWLAPIIIKAKIMMQTLWLEHLSWDDPLPTYLVDKWLTFQDRLKEVTKISIPRWLKYEQQIISCELHGFSDASNQAYAAVVYIRIVSHLKKIDVSLVSAKSKVTPLKPITLPKLELCGALLLSRLMKNIRRILKFEQIPTHMWTDSTVTLAWIKGQPARWKTFVANRVNEIQVNVPDAVWHHISSQSNPSDCASRGLLPDQLRDNNLWWQGPSWLKQDSSHWPQEVTDINPAMVTEELRPVRVNVVQHHNAGQVHIVERFSSLNRLNRVTAYCWRFIYNLRHNSTERITTALTPAEITTACQFWIKTVQQVIFEEDYQILCDGLNLPKSSVLYRLRPFIDDDGVIRVGGRLRHSMLNFEERHPMIIPRKSHFTNLIVDQAHRTMLHGGTQLTMSYIRQRFWIIGGRAVVRSHIHRCVVCLRQRAVPSQPSMGDLPAARVTPAPPFYNSGVDYAGPIAIRTSKGRGHKSEKGYIAIFVCFATRAVHLEAVSDYTAQGFIAAFKRFTARRGICGNLYSDNGTNFVGANQELQTLFGSASKEWRHLTDMLATDGTKWHFIPPSAPQFGGLWEAGVKSTKHHLCRVIGETTLTYEELATLLTQIEACLNSRPIHPLTDDCEDDAVLTPGHFLIGRAPTTVPEPSLLEIPTNRMTRWQLVRQMQEHFWSRWSTEYLHQLQQRYKWNTPDHPVKIGDVALLKDERLPPTKWALARIINTHPGSDQQIRVVTIRSRGSILKRPVNKLCLLPRPENHKDS